MKDLTVPLIVDAQEMQKKHPETFEAPNQEELDAIKKGMCVKICVGSERFWVLVSHIDGDTVEGTVDNNLVFTDEHGLDYGDEVKFNTKNIYAIYE